MTRHGKIARLPVKIRDELNLRLENGEPGVRLVEWLNGLAEVNAVLKEHFEGQPISECNLTQWKNGGFLDWQAWHKAEAMVDRWAGSQNEEGRMQNSETRLRQGCDAASGVAEALTARLMVHYAAALEDAIGGADEKARKHVERLGLSLREVVRVRRYDLAREQAQERAKVDQEWLALERERLELMRASRQAPGANRQAPGAEGASEGGKEPPLSHQEKAEMVKQMVREARQKVSEYESTKSIT